MTAPRALLLLSLVLYIACMPMGAFCEDGVCSDDWPGWGILLFGALDFLADQHNFSWFANPLLIVAWLLLWLGKGRTSWRIWAAGLGVLAFILAAAFMFRTTIMTDESGAIRPITGLRLGYWLWLGSIGAAIAAAAVPRPSVVDQRSN